MVHLRRPEPPQELLRHREQWTLRWQQIRRREIAGGWCTEPAGRILRSALMSFARGKCAFCESKLGRDTYCEIEHYHAKSLPQYVDRAFEWTNLLPACRLCNNSKGDQDHGGSLIKPDEEEPEQLIRVDPTNGNLEPLPAIEDQSIRVRETVRICDLNRGPLSESRFERLRMVKVCLERVNDNPTAENLVLLELLLQPESEYKLVLRQVLTESGNADLLQEDLRRSG